MKKKHWTQTPEGKAKLKQIAEGRNGEEGKDEDVAYALGFVHSWLEAYASRCGIPAATLAYRVGKLLQRTARR